MMDDKTIQWISNLRISNSRPGSQLSTNEDNKKDTINISSTGSMNRALHLLYDSAKRSSSRENDLNIVEMDLAGEEGKTFETGVK